MTEREEFLIEQYKSGKSLRAICREYHISRNNLSKIIKENNITIRDTTVTSRRYFCNDSYFSIIDTCDKAYWLGFIAADGCIQKHSRCNTEYLNVTLSVVDNEHLLKLNKCLDSTYPIKQYQSSGYNKDGVFSRLMISSHKIVTDLQKYGIVFNKTNLVTVPQISQEFIRHYLRGYVDGNGSLFVDTKGYPTLKVCGSYDIVYFMIKFFNHEVKIVNDKNCWSITYHGNYVYDILKQLYLDATMYLNRKYFKALEILKINVDS